MVFTVESSGNRLEEIELIDFLDHVCEEDSPVEIWYKKTFPDVSKRTMQRDFKALEEIGYSILYKREWRQTPDERSIEDDDGKIWMEYEEPLGHYYLRLIYYLSIYLLIHKGKLLFTKSAQKGR